LFQSHLSYGIILWGNSSQYNIQRVLLLQKKAMRVICGLQYSESCKHAFKNMQILTVTGMYIYNLLVYFKMHSNDFKLNAVDHTYETRNKTGFLRPLKHRTALFEKSVTYSATRLYNMLPINVKCLGLNDFKSKLFTFLVNHSFYCLNEFVDSDKNDIML
jgi:hypothetical protein